MHNLKQSLLLLGALGLSACGMLTPPPKAPQAGGPVTEVTPDLLPQGTAPQCSNIAAGGNYPYGSSGPLWRQWVYLNDNGTPLNYSTFTTNLRPSTYYKLTEYTINASGGKAYPVPLYYQYLYSPTFTIPGTLVGAEGNQNVALSNVYLAGTASYGLVYQAATKDYALPVVSSANTYKLVNEDGSTQSTINSASQTGYPRINGNIVRIPGGQPVKLEFYLDPVVKTRQEVIQANYKDPATGTTKNDWVKVNMPYQEAYLKVTTTSYNVYEPSGMKTYQTSTHPLPKFKFELRGYNNVSTTDRRFLTHMGMFYARPYGIGSDQASLNQWLDGRSDYMLQWDQFNRMVARATLDANSDPVLVSGTSSTPANWNLGTPGYTSDFNCISKTVSPENKWNALFSVIQPAATVQATATFNETQQGLKTEYFDNPDFTNKRVEGLSAGIDRDFGGYAPAPYISPETYSVRWSGSVTPQYTETYTFYFSGGKSVQLSINGVKIIDGQNNTASAHYGTATLVAGKKYDVIISYMHDSGNGTAKLEWSSQSVNRQLVPGNVLSPIMVNSTYVASALRQSSIISQLAVGWDYATLNIRYNGLTGYAFNLISSDRNKALSGYLKDGSFQNLVLYTQLNGEGIYKDLMTDKTINLGPVSQYISEQGITTAEQMQAYKDKVIEFLTPDALKYDLLGKLPNQTVQTALMNNGSILINAISKQSLNNPCEDCIDNANWFYGSTLTTARGLFATGMSCLNTIVFALKGADISQICIGNAEQVPNDWDDWNRAKDSYYQCLYNQNINNCDPVLVYDPKSINTSIVRGTTLYKMGYIGNNKPYGRTLYVSNLHAIGNGVSVKWVSTSQNSGNIPVGSLEFLVAQTFQISVDCIGTDLVQGSVEFDSSDPAAPHVAIPVRVECLPLPPAPPSSLTAFYFYPTYHGSVDNCIDRLTYGRRFYFNPNFHNTEYSDYEMPEVVFTWTGTRTPQGGCIYPDGYQEAFTSWRIEQMDIMAEIWKGKLKDAYRSYNITFEYSRPFPGSEAKAFFN